MNEELKVIISAEITNFKQNVEKAKKSFKDFAKENDINSKSIGEGLSKVSDKCKSAMAAFGAAVAGASIALLSLDGATKDYRNEQAQLITAFEAAGSSAGVAKETFNDLYRVLGDTGQAQEAAQHLAKLTTEEQALNEWTTICQGVYATFGASLPIEGLTEAANETAKVGQLTGSLADALNWAGVNEETFQAQLDACNTEAEREALIRETLNGLYTDAAAKYEVNNAAILEQNEAQLKMNDAMATLGEAMAPINTLLASFATEILEKITPYIVDFAETHLPELERILGEVATAIGNVITWVVDNWELVSTIAIIIGTITAALTVLSTIMTVVNAVMYASPITWIIMAIVAAIAALVAIVVVCVKNWDAIKEAALNAWENIKKAWENVGKWFSQKWEDIKGAFANVGGWFKEKFEGAKQGIQTAWSNVGNWFGQKKEQIQNSFAKTKQFFSTTFTGAWNAVKSAWSNPKQFFSDAKTKIQGAFSTIDTWLGNKFGDGWQKVKNVFSGVGAFFGNIWETIKGIFSNIGQKIADSMSGSVKNAVNAVLGTATRIINGFISAINFAIGIINKIPGVNIGKIEPLTAPQLARGGIVDTATLAVIGEQGKEAVVPLENNLEWLNKLATMLNDRMGGTGPIVLQVDGKTFAQISCDSINALTKHRGSIPLVLA